jgi:O-antigen/teichoic acid export membrane protein
MSQSATIVKNSAFVILAKVMNTVFALAIVPFLARYLGKTGFGHYSFAYSFVGMFQAAAWLGVHSIIVREIARSHDQASWYYGNALSVKLLLTLIAGGVLAIATYAYPDLNAFSRQVVLIAGAETLVRTYGTINVSMFRALERMQNEPILRIVDLGTAAIGISLSIIFDLGLVAVMLSFLCGATAYALVGFLLVSCTIARPVPRGDLPTWGYLLKEGLPIGISTGIRRVYEREGAVYLRSHGDVGQVGIYGGGTRAYTLIIMVSTAIANSLFPMLSRRALDTRKALTTAIEVSLKLLLLIASAFAIPLFFTIDTIAPIILGKELGEVALVARLLSPAIVFAFASSLFSTVLDSTNLQKLNTVAWTVVLVLNFGLNLALTPSMGYVGTTLALLTTEIAFALLTFFFIWIKIGRLAMLESVIKPLTIIAISWIVGWILWPKLSLGALVVSVVLYGLLIWKLQVFSKGEIELLRRTLEQVLPRKV